LIVPRDSFRDGVDASVDDDVRAIERYLQLPDRPS